MRALAPEIAELEPLGRSTKCEVLAGVLGGERVVAKVLTHADPIWRWYFEREIRVLELSPATLGAPRVVAAGADVAILSRVEGRPLARHRRVSGEVDGAIIDAALAISDAAAGLDLDPVDRGRARAPEVESAMRRRLLEDPTAPRGWFIDGVERCRSLGLISASDARRLAAAFASAAVATQHGDLLPRNIIAGPGVALIDWECAGRHLAGWDRALLWANLGPAGRSRIEAPIRAIEATGAFRALCVFALAREVKFARPGSPSRSRLESDLAAALAICRR